MGKTQSALFSLQKKKNLKGILWKSNPNPRYSNDHVTWKAICSLKMERSIGSDPAAMRVGNTDPGHTEQPQGYLQVLDLKRTLLGLCSHCLLTLTLLWCIREGWHFTLLVLQQPVQRFTSTQGGHIRKLAEVGSIWLRGISYITVRVLQTAGIASSMLLFLRMGTGRFSCTCLAEWTL